MHTIFYHKDHGPEEIAILFLGADGFATCDALFCQEMLYIGFLCIPQPGSLGIRLP